MNRLLNKAPETLEVDGALYKINTDYRDSLKCIIALQDKDMQPDEIAFIILHNIYEELPENLAEAMKKALWFLRCGDEKESSRDNKKVYDFEIDGTMIYSALLKQGIDLDALHDMHWWKFMAYLSEIGESAFSRIVYLRLKRSKGKLTKEERKECDRIGWDVIRMEKVDQEDQIMAWIRGE